ncbi:MAG TPA: hypothetical protein VMV72_09425 [Verrucomicrobiae bacterium]|nr:hypothetical protein [Verrucomicrobiae bacterium]
MNTSVSAGLTVAQALALPYFVVDNHNMYDYYEMNASPPYHSSFLFKGPCSSANAYLPPVDLIPGLFLVVRVWGTWSLKFFQYEESAMVGDLVHVGGTIGSIDHVNGPSWGGGASIFGGGGFILLSTGSGWMALNSFAAPENAS